jgi:predicted secreted protein
MKKTVLFLIMILLLGVTIFSGCVMQLGEKGSTVMQMGSSGDVDSLPSTLTVTKGSTFGFSLEANMTTGYSWQVYIEDEEILKLVSNDYEPEDTDADGSGGMTTITIEALKKGETKITLEYARDWEGGEVDKTKDMTIVVE